MSDLTIFDFETHPIRVVMVEEQPHWVAPDLAAGLSYQHTPHMLRLLDEDQKGVHLVDTLGGRQSLSIVNESGMWTCVLRSNKPEAKRFRRWLTDVVLPALRQTGTYTMPGYGEAPPEEQPAPLADAVTLDLTRYRLDLDAVALMRRLSGNAAALALWKKLGLPLPDPSEPALVFDDGLAHALAQWVQDKNRLTYQDIGQGLGIGAPDHMAKRRIADILSAHGWTYRNTKFGQSQRWTWHAPLGGETVQ